MATKQQILQTIRETREFKGVGPDAACDLQHIQIALLLDIRHLLDSTGYYESEESEAAGRGEPIEPPPPARDRTRAPRQAASAAQKKSSRRKTSPMSKPGKGRTR